MAKAAQPRLIKNAVYKAQLFGLILINLVVFWVAYNTGSIFDGDWFALARQWQHALLPGIAGVLTALVNAFFNALWKARLIFLRWNHPLPGARAFTVYVHRDPRIDVDRLRQKIGPFPEESAKQNSLWYRLYKTVETRPEVHHAQSDYLILRDWACIAVFLAVFLLPMAAFLFPAPGPIFAFAALLAIQYFFARIAAAHSAERFVTTVLALKSAER